MEAVTTRGVDEHWLQLYDLFLTCDGRTWLKIAGLRGSSDTTTKHTHFLPRPVVARRVRFYPRQWSGRLSTQCHLLGTRGTSFIAQLYQLVVSETVRRAFASQR